MSKKRIPLTDRTTGSGQALMAFKAKVPDPLARQVYVQHLHQKTQKYRNSSDRELFDQLANIIREKQKGRGSGKPSSAGPPHPVSTPGQPPAAQKPPPAPGALSRQKTPKKPHYEMELIRLMIQYGKDMIEYVGRLCNDQLFEDEELKGFYRDIISRYQKGEDVSVEHYAHREPPYPKLTGDVMLEKYTASERHGEKTGTQFRRDKDPFRTAKSTIKPLRLYYLKRFLAEIAEKTKTADPDGKKELIKKQKRTQSEISHMERTPADELFPGPDENTQAAEMAQKKFEYKMKNERNEPR
jgi:DNA primase